MSISASAPCIRLSYVATAASSDPKLRALATWMASSAPTWTGFTPRAPEMMCGPNGTMSAESEDALQNHAPVDHGVGTVLTRTGYCPGELDFGDDARCQLLPAQQLKLERLRLGLTDEKLQQS
jgi:hypothetical protein